MADELKANPKSKPKNVKTSEASKRELKSVKRKDGVPDLKKPKKKGRNKWVWGGGGVFVILVAAIVLTPRIGTIHYGICRAYVELHDPYPAFLEFVQGYEDQNLVDIDYNRIDSFGQRSLNQIRCVFKNGPGIESNSIASVDVNGKANIYPQEASSEVEKFNLGIPSLLKNKPSLVMPKGLSDDIKTYR